MRAHSPLNRGAVIAMCSLGDIRSFHAHVYFDAVTRATAERVRDALARDFDAKISALVDRPVGPHPKPMFQVTIAPEQFAVIVSWLMINRDGLSILVHPATDDPVADHDSRPIWMGEALPIDVEMVRRFVEEKKMKEGSQ